MIGPQKKSGPKVDPIKEAWCLRFRLSGKMERNMWNRLMAQLSFCKSDEARRLLLGISEKYTNEEQDALIVRYSGDHEQDSIPPK